MEVVEEKGRIKEVHDLCDVSFEYHYKDSTFTEEHKDRFRNDYAEGMLERYMAREGCTRFVCVIDNNIRGTIDLYDKAYIRKMYVHPDYLGQGIATALVNKLIEVVRDSGEVRIFSNAGMKGIPFWKRFGFTEWGRVTGLTQRMVLAL